MMFQTNKASKNTQEFSGREICDDVMGLSPVGHMIAGNWMGLLHAALFKEKLTCKTRVTVFS